MILTVLRKGKWFSLLNLDIKALKTYSQEEEQEFLKRSRTTQNRGKSQIPEEKIEEIILSKDREPETDITGIIEECDDISI